MSTFESQNISYYDKVFYYHQSRLRHALKEIVKYESFDELMFDYLKVISKGHPWRQEWLNHMLKDERRHYSWLKAHYQHLTGYPLQVDAPTFSTPSSIEQGLKDMHFRKIKIIRWYTILWYMYNPSNERDTLQLFIWDEQTHLSIISGLMFDVLSEDK
ncbi:hypothetical protein [Texcoconibacillus texcoconensis]|uniref:Rubrerythrin diiron-binding domain-containing protein n=1 Tax=Texcoconibacillus texcoconensis TaxID=1095777 RepID=A0A840QTI3_9BACI|nr:hypothetical protein [Texcoconibacillus texcoconensis]MBB5174675.1 hypothetical protein [Texcoconibacillus texcoconensis]